MMALGSLGFERPEYLWLLACVLPLLVFTVASRRKIAIWRRIAALALRLMVLLALTLALAGVTWKRPADDLAVVFVVDQSASVGLEGQKQAKEFIQDALKAKGDDDVAGIVVFGADAQVEAAPREDLTFNGIEAKVSTHQTDLAAGIRLGAAMLPGDRAGRIVVLTDGEETRGDSASQALLTAGETTQIAVVPIGGTASREVWVEDVVVPGRMDEGGTFEVRVLARAEEPTDGKLRLYRNDTYLGELPVHLEGGKVEVISVRQEASSAGLYRYRAVLEVPGSADALSQNNEGMGTVQVTGRPRVLYAEGYGDQSGYLARVLREQGLAVDVVDPTQIPSGVTGLRPYAAVILSDVPAWSMTQRQQESLRAYVRDMGRGLIMVGGDQSFGLGGYYKTPIEEALPVNMDLEDKSRFPKMAMIHAIDRSCSMGDGAGSKFAMAKEAAVRTAELMNERDELGVIAFDSTPAWVVPLAPLKNKDQVIGSISGMPLGGGTDIYPALDAAVIKLAASDASLKHVITISDGVTAPGDFAGVGKRAQASGITITTIAIGTDSDQQTMSDIAKLGGGQYYLVTDPSQIPAIFSREALLASRSFLIEETFVPARKEPSDLLRGFGNGDILPLHGYVATEPKKRATVALVSTDEYKAPILAHWYYGLGRSVAYTSDSKARWSKDWVGTESYTRLWTQSIRWVIGDPSGAGLQVESEIREGELLVTVDAFDPDGGFRNFLDGEARVIAPDLTTRPLELRQVGPGRYRAELPVDQDGSWLVGVAMRDGDQVVGQQVVEAVQPYSPEYRKTGLGPVLIAEIGSVGGGGVLSDPAKAFERSAVPISIPYALWPGLVVLAACLFLVDVAVRRLELRSTPLGAPQRLVGATAVPGRVIPRPAARTSTRVVPAMQPTSSGEKPASSQPSPPPLAPSDPPNEVDGFAGRLLASKRNARKKPGDDT